MRLKTPNKPKSPEGRTVGYLGALILATVTVLAGVSVYLVMAQQSRTVLGQSLGILLQQKVYLFSQEIDQSQGIDSREVIAYRHALLDTLQQAKNAPNQQQARADLQRIVQSFQKNNFLAVQVFNSNNEELTKAGRFSEKPKLRIALDTNYPAHLLWDGQFILSASIAIVEHGETIGRVVTEMAMPKLTAAFNNIHAIGETGEFVLCKIAVNDPRYMQCFINGFQNEQFFDRQLRVVDGVSLPMDLALRDETGLSFANDYRSVPVVAAYGPVGDLGLGIVLKIDQAELYAPVTSSLKYIVPLLALLFLIGILLLRWLVSPLIRNLITSRNAVQIANLDLQKSKARSRLVIDHAPYSIHEMDHNGNFLSLNPAGRRMKGVAKESDVLGSPFLDSVSVADKKRLSGLMEAGFRHEASEFEFTGASGKIYQSAFVPIVDPNDNVLRLMGWTQDITTAKLHAEQLLRSQKMDALGKLTGGIAHDFNNLLGIILGYSEMLEEPLQKDPVLASYVLEIQKAGSRGAKLTKRLLGFSRDNQSERQELNVNSILRGLRNMLEKTLTARVELQLSLAKEIWPVELDQGELEDAIINISINAMHAMEGTGWLAIGTENISLREYAAHSLNLQQGDYVKLTLTDNGCGMDEETREKIFYPFYTTKGEKGTGLGLNQVFSFISRSNGAIHVISKPGVGTCIELYFARLKATDDDDNAANTEKPQTNEQPKANDDGGSGQPGGKHDPLAGTETILVVDDEKGLLDLTARLLQRKGYQVFTASSGIEALKILETEEIRLMLSDIIMPKMDGFELTETVRQKYPDVKIQLASGFAERVPSPAGAETTKEEWLRKPYRARDLYKKLRKLLDA